MRDDDEEAITARASLLRARSVWICLNWLLHARVPLQVRGRQPSPFAAGSAAGWNKFDRAWTRTGLISVLPNMCQTSSVFYRQHLWWRRTRCSGVCSRKILPHQQLCKSSRGSSDTLEAFPSESAADEIDRLWSEVRRLARLVPSPQNVWSRGDRFKVWWENENGTPGCFLPARAPSYRVRRI